MTSETWCEMRENLVLPNTLMDILHSPYSDKERANLRWAELAMLRALYLDKPDDERVETARSAFRYAVETWSDGQIEDFLVNYLIELPESAVFHFKSSFERRQMLSRIFCYLFENEDWQKAR